MYYQLTHKSKKEQQKSNDKLNYRCFPTDALKRSHLTQGGEIH